MNAQSNIDPEFVPYFIAVIAFFVIAFILVKVVPKNARYFICVPWVSLKDLEFELTPRELRRIDWNTTGGRWTSASAVRLTKNNKAELRNLLEFAAHRGVYVQDYIFDTHIEHMFESDQVNAMKDRMNDEIQAYGFVMLRRVVGEGNQRLYVPKDEPKVDRKQVLPRPGFEGLVESVSGFINEIKSDADERNQLKKMIEDSIAKRNAENNL